MQVSHTILLKEPVSLCAEEHRRLGILQPLDVDDKTENLFEPVILPELVEVIQHHSVFFFGDDQLSPVAITGLHTEADLPSQRMAAGYQTFIRRLYPFALQKLPEQNAGVLVFDAASTRIKPAAENADVTALFAGDGNPTAILHKIGAEAAQYYEGWQQAQEFTTGLKEAGLLIRSPLKFTLEIQGKETPQHFYMIDENAYRNLPANTVYKWFQKGWLEAAGLIILSHLHWYRHLKSTQNTEQA